MFCGKINKKLSRKITGLNQYTCTNPQVLYTFFLMKGQRKINLTLVSMRADFPKDVKENVKLIKY
jgi:hypothetical protein